MSIASFRQGLTISRPGSRRRAPAGLSLTVWWHATELDRRLAAGEDRWASDALALRARRLTTSRSRARVARGLAGALRSARSDRPRFTAAVRPSGPDVLDAERTVASLERRLRAPGPVAAQGVAIIRLLLTDGNGPLYQSSDPHALGTRLRAAATLLRIEEDVAA
jgi:hypothetical protein